MTGEGEKLSGTRMNSQLFYVEEKGGRMYVASEQNMTLIKVAMGGVAEGSLLTGGALACPGAGLQ